MDLTNVVSLSFPAYLSIISLILVLVSYTLISYKLFDKLFPLFANNPPRFFLSFFSAALLFLVFVYLRSKSYELTIIPVIFIFLLLFIKKYLKTYHSILSVTILIIFFSAVSSFLLRKSTIEKESQYRSILALQLSRTSDPVTEYTFLTFEDNITKDTIIKNYLAQYKSTNQDIINNYLKYNYFDKIFPGYNVFLTICNQGNILNIQPDNYLILCEDYFLSQILNYCDTTPSSFLFRYHISHTYSYLVKLPYIIMVNDSISTFTIYAEAYYNSYPDEGLGYPELLVEEGNISYPDLSDYSYARYYQNNLFYKFGNVSYRHKLTPVNLSNSSFEYDGNIHYYFELADQNVILLSKEKPTFLDKISPFSFLFLTISIIVLIFVTIFNIIPSGSFNGINLRNRFQVMIIILLIFVFLFIGAISITFIIRFNNDKNHDILEEKTFSVLTELEHKLSSEPVLTDSLSDYLSTLLTKFSQVFFSDINLYDLSGNLLATSRPGIFSKGLTSELMDPGAYRAIFFENKILHIQHECIGHYDYLSAYVPFRNSNNEISAIVNLPYFARQTELRSEISSFLSTYINIYILFIILSMLISLLVSRYVTRPLQLLKTKLAQLSLKNENEKIVWSAKDEIGTLVAEYNRMVDELEKNALFLAQSERENAWREMARQVAHEIKNPLTPMKLSVQALLKSWNDKSPDFPDRLKRFTDTITEQIDSLSYIAVQFSNLYNLPEPKNEEFNLSSVLLQTADLFKDSSIQNTSIACKVEPNCIFTGDKKLFSRVFTNLIQNSVQALSDKIDGQIIIKLYLTPTSIIIQISDNGPGIPSEISHKIFQPNFTTKSGGMGLGLAMVKSIIDYYKGAISFNSRPDKGTTFTIELPVNPAI
ncbi:MAG: HAMP domain-containing histidine kinase [Bacteroidetes bacterium]|nr:HAMP domain-containing histidine kinase [Bacteroidota bacterium]